MHLKGGLLSFLVISRKGTVSLSMTSDLHSIPVPKKLADDGDGGDEVRNLLQSIRRLAPNQQTALLQQLAIGTSSSTPIAYPNLPEWYDVIKAQANVVVVDDSVREYRDEMWRLGEGGFSGTDLMHSRSRAACRVLEYLLIPNERTTEPESGPRLIGAAYFSEASEGHKGLCHGGSMCALCDDALGWIGFCADGIAPKPWSGYTVQVDVSLKKPVLVGSLLRLEAWIERREGPRKIWACCKLVDPETDQVHCTAKGLFLLSPEYITQPTTTSTTAAKSIPASPIPLPLSSNAGNHETETKARL